jgi:hypothetical protein
MAQAAEAGMAGGEECFENARPVAEPAEQPAGADPPAETMARKPSLEVLVGRISPETRAALERLFHVRPEVVRRIDPGQLR